MGIAAAVVTVRQKTRSDNRAEWWRRYTWATEQSFSKEPHESLVGWVNLDILLKSPLVTGTEREVIQTLSTKTEGKADD